MSDAFMAPVLPQALPDNPLHWAEAWLIHASENSVQRNPNAMTLATVGAQGEPSSRVVLCKAFFSEPGYLVFYTNYRSKKVAELTANPRVALTFHWDALGRQVRLRGLALRSPAAESDAYFATRDRGSQLGAWGSDQSAALRSREALLQQIRARAETLGLVLDENLRVQESDGMAEVPRPPHWGGIRVWPQAAELWIEGADRIHDRAEWTRKLEPAGEHAFKPGPWSGTRLQP
jgi:pyridoxamine 5'-phosphate oxidase